MDAGFFEIDAWGPPVGGGAADARYCTLEGVAKIATPNSELAVENESICGRLGTMLSLPIPPGAVMSDLSGVVAYVALRFGPKGQKPPPVIPDDLVQDDPFLSAGVVAFDCWIANEDRNTTNLAYSRQGTGKAVFDHERALMGTRRADIQDRLLSLIDSPVCSGCVAPLLTDGSEVLAWAHRIEDLTSDDIRSVCNTVTGGSGLTLNEATAVTLFLVHRRDRLVEMLKAGLPNVVNWGLLP